MRWRNTKCEKRVFADSVTEERVNNLFFGEENRESAVYPRESLSAWYKRSSYGKLNVTGEVVSITLDHDKSYYETSDNNPNGETKLLNEIWEKTGALELSWEDFDSDKDQYVDENNIKKGTAKVTIKGIGDTYGGTKTIKFTIRAKGLKWK